MSIRKIIENKYISNYIRDSKLIVSIILIFAVWALVFLFTLYKPIYRSNAMIWVKNIVPDTFVADFSKDGQLTPLSQAGNPIITQTEILKSHTLRQYLAHYIRENYPEILKNVKDEDKFVDNLIKTDNKAGSDIINITLGWRNPKIAQDLLAVYLNEYERLNIDLNKNIKANKRKYIESKLSEITGKLLNIRNQIQKYKTNSLAINLNEEANRLVDQRIDFSSQLENVAASINSSQHMIRSIEQQLSLNSKEALNAVALGYGNENLNKLRYELNESTQQYVFDKVKLSETNPKLIALKNKIGTINGQIEDQIKLTLGDSARKNGISIFDPARSKLVTDLASAQTQLMGLKAQKASLRRSINNIKRMQSKLPIKALILGNLEQQEKSFGTAYDQLKQKQIEARIKEAEDISSIVIVDRPDLPKLPSFPTKSQILAFSLILGGIFGFAASSLKTFSEDTCRDIDCIKAQTNSIILGIIPWLKNINKKVLYEIAYKNTASNLMFQSNKIGAKILTFTSSTPKKYKAPIIYLLASELRKIGNRVLLIDTDFVNPTIHKEANITAKINASLSDLIKELENKLKTNQIIETKEILDAVVQDNNELSLLCNNYSVNDPYQYFGTSAFNIIISTLRENFDFVLIDTSSALIAPEFPIISRATDGIVLFTNMGVSSSSLKKITSIIENTGIPLFGIIVRESDSNLEKDYAEYIRSTHRNEQSLENKNISTN